MKRIEFIANLLKGKTLVLDIGTDHGYVLKYAFEKNYIKSAIATDINPQPLAVAKKNLKGYPVDFVLSDGFKSITDHSYDIAVICGMGARLIIDIIKSNPKPDPTYLLSCNDKPHILREFLTNNGFEIFDEFVVKDNFFYVIMLVRKGNQVLSQQDIYIGPILKTKKEAIPYYQNNLRIYKSILPKVKGEDKTKLEKIIDYYNN